SRVANVNHIAGHFHPDVVLNLAGFGRGIEVISGRNELQQIALAARQNVPGLNVRFNNVHIKVAEDELSARVNLTAVVRFQDQADPAVQDIKMEFENVDGDWLIR